MADITNPSQPQKRKVPTALEIALSKAETSQTTQPPAGAIPAEELEGGKPFGRRITLGRDVTTGKPVTIDNRDRVRGNYGCHPEFCVKMSSKQGGKETRA